MKIDKNALAGVLATHIADSGLRESILADLNAVGDAKESSSGVAEIAGAAVDLDRQRRCGFPEVVFAEGKPPGLVADIMQRLVSDQQAAFATRVSAEQAETVLARLPQGRYNDVARTLCVPVEGVSSSADGDIRQPRVAVVSAGSCDASVACEAYETLQWMQIPSRLIEDVGVAGPQRLLQHVPFLQTMSAVVCVAGMEAALPSVLGGHVGCPVIGVPTSVGYGLSLDGVTALLSMMTCCASNVVTVNIDAGFRGGYVAGMMAQAIIKAESDG